jgi:hypothetical protein
MPNPVSLPASIRATMTGTTEAMPIIAVNVPSGRKARGTDHPRNEEADPSPPNGEAHLPRRLVRQ